MAGYQSQTGENTTQNLTLIMQWLLRATEKEEVNSYNRESLQRITDGLAYGDQLTETVISDDMLLAIQAEAKERNIPLYAIENGLSDTKTLLTTAQYYNELNAIVSEQYIKRGALAEVPPLTLKYIAESRNCSSLYVVDNLTEVEKNMIVETMAGYSKNRIPYAINEISKDHFKIVTLSDFKSSLNYAVTKSHFQLNCYTDKDIQKYGGANKVPEKANQMIVSKCEYDIARRNEVIDQITEAFKSKCPDYALDKNNKKVEVPKFYIYKSGSKNIDECLKVYPNRIESLHEGKTETIYCNFANSKYKIDTLLKKVQNPVVINRAEYKDNFEFAMQEKKYDDFYDDRTATFMTEHKDFDNFAACLIDNKFFDYSYDSVEAKMAYESAVHDYVIKYDTDEHFLSQDELDLIMTRVNKELSETKTEIVDPSRIDVDLDNFINYMRKPPEVSKESQLAIENAISKENGVNHEEA